MVFGHPRQDDLLEHLVRKFAEHHARQLTERGRIDLAPPEVELTGDAGLRANALDETTLKAP